MNIVFIGASKFGLRCLDLARNLPGCEIVGVVTSPQRFSISYRPQGVVNVLHADFAGYCEEFHIPCVTTSNGMKHPGLFNRVKGWQPEILLVAGWYHMIPDRWRKLAPAYGLHASLLPDYSGGAPLVWAIINGEAETGITLFQFGAGVDDGPVVGQLRTEIGVDDTIATLYDRIEDLGLSLVSTHLPRLAENDYVLTVQDESRRRIFPQRSPEDGLIDWNQSARRIRDFVRAQTRPYPGAFSLVDGRRLTIWAAQEVEMQGVFGAGAVIDDPNRLLIGTLSGVLEVGEVGWDDEVIPGPVFKRRLKSGDLFGCKVGL